MIADAKYKYLINIVLTVFVKEIRGCLLRTNVPPIFEIGTSERAIVGGHEEAQSI
jgi:hypothetical protein